MSNKIQLLTGIICIVIAAILLLGNFLGDSAFPGANGKIALEVYEAFPGSLPETDIFVVNPDGSGLKQLTDDGVSHRPDWSADGRLIAFDGPDDKIWVMNADGSGQRQVTDNNVADYDPAWSPDGSKIAFNRYDEQSDSEIWVMNADGSDASEQQVTDNSVWDSDPCWSPDGRKIAFGRGRDIWVMNADGTGEERIVEASERQETYDSDWQPIRARPVGGVVVPANKLAVLAPYLTLIGLVGAVTVAVATTRRRKP